MADKLKNIAGLFKQGRTRVILITTFGAMIVAILVGIISIRRHVIGSQASASIQQAPSGIQSVPFNAPNAAYAKLQRQQNSQQAQEALKTGTSAIPTIVQAEKLQTPPPSADYGVGFTALNREQSNSDAFQAQSFNTGNNSANKNASSSCAIPVGSPVCDEQNKILGFVQDGGKVKGLSGQIIGNAEPNGTVTDGECGKIVGKICTNRGTPVYDNNGKIIGYLGPDGKVRDVNGAIIGTVGADGKIHDLNGNVIGEVGSAPAGSPVYDSNGNLLGHVDKDGNVRDANGNIIGRVGADGIVRGLNGQVIGQAGSTVSGTPVYDSNGNLIGYVGPDGKVRDKSGTVIGTLGADGLVRDVNGKVIGNVATPVYDSNGHLIGFAGPDGKVRNANGDIIGEVGADGTVRDKMGRIIGKAGAISPGTTVCNGSGVALGVTGPDGKVRAANGDILGYINVNGEVQNSQGLVVGSITCKPTSIATAALDTTNSSNTSSIPSATDTKALLRQQALQNQQLQNQVQQAQQSMTQQASQLLTAWTSPIQQMVTGAQTVNTSDTSGVSNGTVDSGGNVTTKNTTAGPVFIKAGSIYYGTLKTAINSDEPGPILATIINGPYKGSTLLGELANQGQAVKLTFNLMSVTQLPTSVSINAVAIDQNTARTALSTYTDNHYLLRYGSLFAASFLQGYGQAYTQSGSQTSSNGLTTTQTSPDLSGAGKFYVALGNVGTQFSSQLGSVYSTPPTVYVASGTALGILFLTDVSLPNT